VNITFNEELHEYRDEKGRIIPSVTQIIKDAGVMDFSCVPADVLDDASERGTLVHLITELHDRGGVEDVDPALQGYFEGYKKFLKDFQIVKFPAIEEMIYHSAGYAGRLDRMAIDAQDAVYLYDIKSGVKHPAHDLQVAAYAYGQKLVKPNSIDVLGTLYLKADGNYQFSKTENGLFAFQVFTGILTIYKWKKVNKLI